MIPTKGKPKTTKAAATKKKPATKEKPAKDFVADWFLLQRRMISRSTQFFERLSDLASQGAIEPREYIEESFNLWSGALEELGEWLNPEAPITVPPHPIARVDYPMRSERGDIRFTVPSALFEICGEDATITLFTDGLISVVNPENNLRPTATFAPDQNLRLDPVTVTRTKNKSSLKVYGVASGVTLGDRYRGVVWGESDTMPGKTFPVAFITVTIK